MAKKYMYFNLVAQRGHQLFDPPDRVDTIEFRVRGTSHTQHIWDETHIDGLAKSAEKKIHDLKQAGYRVYAWGWRQGRESCKLVIYLSA
jgi:hypothetical protein